MIHRYSPFRRVAGWRRHIALAVLFALQGAITLAPLIEPSEKGRIGAHAEEQGALHKYQHDETTCVVGAVRSQHSAPSSACPPISSDRAPQIASLMAAFAPGRHVVPATLPRAPPVLN